MKNLCKNLCTLLMLTTIAFAAGGDHKHSHEGDHMHNGKMSNHNNPHGLTDAELKKMIEIHEYMHKKMNEKKSQKKVLQ